MKIRLLSTALLAGLAFAQVANAQEFDDRWYLTGSAGMNIQDNDRGTRNAPFGALGVGKFLNPNWSLDGELNYQNPNNDDNQNLNWSQYGVSIDLRRHFLAEGRNWAPYLLMGLGYQRSEEEFDAFPNPDSPGEREEGNLAAKVGVGLQTALGERVVDAYRTGLPRRLRRRQRHRSERRLVRRRAGFGRRRDPAGCAAGGRSRRLRSRRAAPTWTTTATASTTATTSARVRRLARPSVRTAARCRCRST